MFLRKTNILRGIADKFTKINRRAFCAAALGFAVLITGLLWTTCENASGSNVSLNDAVKDTGAAVVTALSYGREQAELRIVFDKDIPELSADDITIQDTQRYDDPKSSLVWEKGALRGPDENHAYALPVNFFKFTRDPDTGITVKYLEKKVSAAIKVSKAGWAFANKPDLLELERIDVKLNSLTAYPAADTAEYLQKLILTFDKPVPGLSPDDIYLYTPASLKKTGIEDKGGGVYELAVDGYNEAGGKGLVYLGVRKNGYFFINGRSSANDSASSPDKWVMGINNNSVMDNPVTCFAYFKLARINSVTIDASPLSVPQTAEFPVTINLEAAVDASGDVPDAGVLWTLKNSPEGVTLNVNASDGKKASLTITDAVKTGGIKVSAASVYKASVEAEAIILVDKNAAVAETAAAFEDALWKEDNLIVINSRIQAPVITVDIAGEPRYPPHTIEVREGGKLVIGYLNGGRGSTKTLWKNNGWIKVRSGGGIEFWGYLRCAGISFGNDEIVFPGGPPQSSDSAGGGMYEPAITALGAIPVALSFDGNARRLTVSTVESGIAVKDARKTVFGVTSYFNPNAIINVPAGYSILLKESTGLDFTPPLSLALDFGTEGSNALEAGLMGWIEAEGGDAILTSVPTGLALSSGSAGGSVLTYDSDLYCAAGKEVIFEGNPLTARKRVGNVSQITMGNGVLKGSDNYARYLELIPSGGDVKVQAGGVPGEAASFAERSISRWHGVENIENTVTLKIERINGAGRLAIPVYPMRNPGLSGPKPVNIGYSLTEFDLGGAGSDWVGRIILTKDKYEITYPAPESIPAAIEIGSAANSTALKAGGITLITAGGYHGSPATAILRNDSSEDLYIDSGSNPFAE